MEANTAAAPDTTGPAFWSTCLATRLTRGDGRYPAGVLAALGPEAPCALTVLGDTGVLAESLTAVLCSTTCPADLVLRAYDLACLLASRDVVPISGFHSPTERECLRVLLRGSRPTVWCPARGLGPYALSPGHLRAVAEGCLVVLTPFARSAQRATARSARLRNLLVVSAAHTVLVIHAASGGSVERCCKEALAWGRRVLVLDSPHNRGLLALGAEPVDTACLRTARLAPAAYFAPFAPPSLDGATARGYVEGPI